LAEIQVIGGFRILLVNAGWSDPNRHIQELCIQQDAIGRRNFGERPFTPDRPEMPLFSDSFVN